MIGAGWLVTARHYTTMGLKDLFADNALVRLVRGDTRQADMIVSMTGIKLGERLLVIGLADGRILAALGAKVGLTGRACGIDASPEVATRAARFAEKEGVLVEVRPAPAGDLPFEPGGFDIVVVRAVGNLSSEATLRQALAAAATALREGGRCEILADTASDAGASLVALFGSCGYRGGRVLANRDGLLYVEAVKRRA